MYALEMFITYIEPLYVCHIINNVLVQALAKLPKKQFSAGKDVSAYPFLMVTNSTT